MTDLDARAVANRRLLRRMLVVVVLMFGFGFALAPLYDVLCRVTGLNGKPSDTPTVLTGYEVDEGRTVTVEFLANVNTDDAWGFRPKLAKLKVTPGRSYEITYLASNPTDRVQTIQAVPSVAPGLAAQHLHKIQCFCFNQQQFQPRETREMPVRFFIDPDLPPETGTVSLAYTLFTVDPASQRVTTALAETQKP